MLLCRFCQEKKIVVDLVVFLTVQFLEPFRVFQHDVVGGIYLRLRRFQAGQVFCQFGLGGVDEIGDLEFQVVDGVAHRQLVIVEGGL